MNNQVLDSEELLHLALNAIHHNQHSEAIEFLKRALEQAPNEARLHYLLGAEYAQIGLYERAIGSMTQAIEFDPNLHLAIFQLGLLYLTQGMPEEAINTWAPLTQLPSENPLYLFSIGLKHLAKDEFAQCKQNLEEGIKQNQTLPVLNEDMQRILDQLETLAAQNNQSPPPASKKSVFIQAYTDFPNDDDTTIH